MKLYIHLWFLLCVPFVAEGGRKSFDNYYCQCGVKVVRDNIPVSSWILYVHRTVEKSQTRTCVGVIIASNIVLTSQKCLMEGLNQLQKGKEVKGKSKPQHVPQISDVKVTDSKIIGEGISYPVLGILGKENLSLVGIQVAFDFSLRESKNKPVCIPTQNEPVNIVSVGANVTYVGAKAGAIQNLVVKQGNDCNPDKKTPTTSAKKLHQGTERMENEVLCVTIADNSVELEVGQPFFIEIPKNPYHRYPYGFYTYLAGLSTVIKKGKDGQRNLFFDPITSLVQSAESLINITSTTWCSQPWPWLNAPENIKRDESLDCECGLLNEQVQGRIVGGEDASPYEFPWMVTFNAKIWHMGEYVQFERGCGATIISDRVILTASHCFAGFTLILDESNGYDIQAPNQTYSAILHTHFRKGDDQDVEVGIVSGILHPGFIDGWRKPGIEQDIGLFILDTPLNFSATGADGKFLYRPTCLPKRGETIDVSGREGIAIGWGYNSSDKSTFPDSLQKTIFNLKTFETCKKELNIQKDSPLICSTDEKTHAMQGDSGGPVFVKDEMGKHTQVGVFSYIQSRTNENGDEYWASFLTDVQDTRILSFVDYYSDQVGAKYCKK